MPGLRWTRWGAVALPETLQVRLHPLFADRVAAAAPVPQRALTLGELSDNLRFFCLPGPRGRPISGVVLSGLPQDASELGAVASAVAEARRSSVRRCVAHVDRDRLDEVLASPLADQLEALVVAVRAPRPLSAGRLPLHVVIPLEAPTVAALPAILDAVRPARPERVVLTWPFPGGRPPAPASELVPGLRAAQDALAGLPWSLKGLPPCALTELLPPDALESRVSRSSNRWYVDAAYQKERALLFLPEVVRFAKREVCRFCDLDRRCDGVAEEWLAKGLAGELKAVFSGGQRPPDPHGRGAPCGGSFAPRG